MLRKSLIQFSFDVWGCVPSLLFGLRLLDTQRQVWLSLPRPPKSNFLGVLSWICWIPRLENLFWVLELSYQCENFFFIIVLQFVCHVLSGSMVGLMATSSMRLMPHAG